MSPLRLIVVGLGARAQMWLRVLDADPDVQIVALCDPDPAARTRAGEKYPSVPIGASFDAVIDAEAEAVLLCTPPSGREKDMELACANGLAILAEKPLSDNVAEAARFVAKADAAGVLLIVGLNWTFYLRTMARRKPCLYELVPDENGSTDALGTVDPSFRPHAVRLRRGAHQSSRTYLQSVMVDVCRRRQRFGDHRFSGQLHGQLPGYLGGQL
jgi:hypothetical protein